MWKVTWRNLFARKVRLLLSGFAIVLGVAFVAGSFILTDTIRDAFTGIIKSSTADVQIAPKGAGNFDSVDDSRVIAASVVDKLKTLPQAAQVDGGNSVQGVYVLDSDHKVVSGGGRPWLGLRLRHHDGDHRQPHRHHHRRQATGRDPSDRPGPADRRQGRLSTWATRSRSSLPGRSHR